MKNKNFSSVNGYPFLKLNQYLYLLGSLYIYIYEIITVECKKYVPK